MPSSTSAELSDLVYDILNNTVDAILKARLDQERKYFELIEDTLLSLEEFSEKYDLRNEIIENLENTNAESSEIDGLIKDIFEERKQVVSDLLESGPPKLRVQNGNIKIRVAFSREEIDPIQQAKIDAKNANTAALKSMRATKMGKQESTLLTSNDLRNKNLSIASQAAKFKIENLVDRRVVNKDQTRKIQVRLPDPSKPNEQQSNLFGEININFSID
ncbi:MAG: hypothetical protein AAGF87_16610 [Bacteroidota bacterium]